MLPSRESPSDITREHANAPAVGLLPACAEILLRVLAISGYGLWIWLGMGLVLGMNRIGNGAMQMPLLLGTALVCAGLGLGRMRLSATTEWYGGPSAERRWPRRAAGMALACFLPVLLLLALGDGHGHVLAMRLAGVALLLCSLASLVHSAYRFRSQLTPDLQRMASTLPVSRLVTAWYCGGLWLWLCIMVQGGPEPGQGASVWILLLLALALLLGLLEGMRWQSLGPSRDDDHDMHLSPLRLFAALFVYVLPCAALLLTDRFGGGLLAAALAVPSCLLGKMLEQHVYETALAGGFPTIG
ncbi:hypothetical protein [Rhodanobacter ginsengiterrae]|uniref:hypothetical protein n=1 Tax=Rhodanobacter ginsengiterrae TaxID=2008451 RepID=UPI003CF8873A